MPDISMCATKGCKKAATCYRVQCKADQWGQSYSYFPKDTKKKPCEYYVKCTVIGATAVMHQVNDK